MTKPQLLDILKHNTTYNSLLRQHYYNGIELSNAGLRSLCKVKLGALYDKLSDKEKKIMIDEMFIELRGAK